MEGGASVAARQCRFGGEGEIGSAVELEYELPRQWIDTAGSVQEYGLRKHSCYGLFAQDTASVTLHSCRISYCSESAIFLRDQVMTSLGSLFQVHAALLKCCAAVHRAKRPCGTARCFGVGSRSLRARAGATVWPSASAAGFSLPDLGTRSLPTPVLLALKWRRCFAQPCGGTAPVVRPRPTRALCCAVQRV